MDANFEVTFIMLVEINFLGKLCVFPGEGSIEAPDHKSAPYTLGVLRK